MQRADLGILFRRGCRVSLYVEIFGAHYNRPYILPPLSCRRQARVNAFRRWIGSHMKLDSAKGAPTAARTSVDSDLFTQEYMALHSWPTRDIHNDPPNYVPRVLEAIHTATVAALLRRANREHYAVFFPQVISKKFNTATASWNKLVRTTFQRH
jgi:hypothetical protein